jgi:micrococcal nuclease
MNRLKIAFLFLCSLSLCASASAWPGKIMLVFKGDVLAVSGGAYQEDFATVLLSGIDCPEPGQAFCDEAAAFILKQTDDIIITCDIVSLDQFGNRVCVVSFPDGSTLNEKLVAAGLAWVTEDCTTASWRSLQEKAKAARIGLWAGTSPISPWEYRRKAESAKP